MAVATEIEQDGSRGTFFLAANRLVDRALHGMVGLGRRHDAFVLRKEDARLKTRYLVMSNRLDERQFLEMRDERRHAVIAQAAGVEARRYEGRPERVHFRQRRHLARVAEVVRVAPARKARARGRFDRDGADFPAAAELRPDEREGDAREVRPATGAADHDVGVVVGHLHLRDRFLADDRLVQQHVIQDRPERVVGVAGAGGDFDCL